MKTKYKYRAFNISNFHGDNEFEHLCNFLSPAHLHTCATNEHIREIGTANQVASEMWVSLHTSQAIHKINDNISGTRHDKMLPYKKWDIKRPHTSGHHPRVPESILQQTEDHIWSIFTSLHMHYQQ